MSQSHSPSPSSHHAPHGHHHHGSSHGHGDSGSLSTVLDLDAEVLGAYVDEVTAWIAQQAGDRPVRRILDLGSGTGAGAFALLRRFPAASVTAVDADRAMLDRLTGRAHELGLQERVQPVVANLDEGWPAVGEADLVWASGSLHHLAEPVRVLESVRAALAPGGVLAVMELDGMPWFLPESADPAERALEARTQELQAQARAEHLPHMGADWRHLLEKAGFTVTDRVLNISVDAPLPPAGGKYAAAVFGRVAEQVGDRLTAEESHTLDRLLAALPQRNDLVIRTTRTALIGSVPHPAP
ncbi:class I SAM-dependent methyltransferase [Actinoplanes sp. RD1]|uniref:class I SAM-dependent methyltransferase n=1 Tax=Actinoplanes sp. RD1 TaxID=3064538 RepID=UPI002741D4ED|nr:class I SAM-dependent methyltransferase [Actinoplanes sp. RD1]